ncbi:hypothetical protein NC653_029183 [Populus alba x Populus x berolinensis]|uniref:Uncharacterized protein n=1 Tax=Populus alba x Populus x berolinensis TaxID=444605 RepID=A0AAD6M2K0_9ROSI|nr:hypothetical protein NC653_029183 [Populus alba x Populus x berolinensis]
MNCLFAIFLARYYKDIQQPFAFTALTGSKLTSYTSVCYFHLPKHSCSASLLWFCFANVAESIFCYDNKPFKIENEYGNVEAAFHEKRPPYVKWAAKMVVWASYTGVP